MWNLITAPENTVFGVALMLMLMLGLLELISLLSGGFTDFIDKLLPDSLTGAHAEVGLDVADAGVFIRFLSWLYVGKVPLLMLMVVFLAVFGLTGLLVQTAFHAVIGSYLNAWLASAATWLACLPLVRGTAAALYKIMPKDETTAVAQNSLIGRVGVVVIGEARQGSAAQVRVKDQFGQQHYVMAESDTEAVLKQGDAVLLVSAQGSMFKAIANPSGSLTD